MDGGTQIICIKVTTIQIVSPRGSTWGIADFFRWSDGGAVNIEEEIPTFLCTKLGAMSSVFLLFSWSRLAVIQVFME